LIEQQERPLDREYKHHELHRTVEVDPVLVDT